MMSKQRWIQLLVGGLIAVSLTGCSSQPSQPALDASATPRLQAPTRAVIVSTVTQQPTRSPGVEPSPLTASTRQWTAMPIAPAETITKEKSMSSGTPIPPPLDSSLQSFVRQAQEDLAKRLAVTADQIELVEVRDVAWPDTSLGCPQPGMAYAQIITPGYRLVLTAGGKTYEYHADTQRRMVYCESKVARLLLGGESTESVRLAKEDLARRLGVSVDSITVGAVIGQEFSTDAFYCRATKDRIARDESPAVMSGWSILLSASGRRYEYHASGQTVILCRPLP